MTQFAIEQSSIGRIVVPDPLPPGIGVMYTTRDFPGRITDDIAAGLNALVRERFGIDASLSTCTQVHGATIRRAQHSNPWRECSSCDALWSAERGTTLAIKIADCLPVTVADLQHHVLANIHSGWRGAVQRITAETLDTLTRESGFDASSAHAWLGPTIRGCCFEVGEEVVEELKASYDDIERFVDRSRSRPHVDLPGLTAGLLRERGLAGERIHDSGLCTRCEGSVFHSYRRDGKGSGRNLAIAAQ